MTSGRQISHSSTLTSSASHFLLGCLSRPRTDERGFAMMTSVAGNSLLVIISSFSLSVSRHRKRNRSTECSVAEPKPSQQRDLEPLALSCVSHLTRSLTWPRLIEQTVSRVQRQWTIRARSLARSLASALIDWAAEIDLARAISFHLVKDT